MRPVLMVAIAAAMSWHATGAVASDSSDALAVVQKFTAAATREAYAAFCAPDAVFIDHVPPYVFSGPTACQDEWDAVLAWIERSGVVVSDYGKLTKPSFVDATSDRVYAVYPVTASLTRNGKPEVEKGFWTFVLRRGTSGWRIAGVTWSTLEFVPVPTPGGDGAGPPASRPEGPAPAGP